MKQNLMVFTKNEPVLCKEYLCSSSSCLEFIFKECLGDEAPLCSELSCLDYYGDDEDVVNKTEQIFDFTAVPSFVSLFSGRQNEPCTLHKLQKKVPLKKISLIHLVTCGTKGTIGTSGKFFKGYYLKQCRSKQISQKKSQISSTPIVFASHEFFDTYVDITNNLYLDVQSFKLLIQKANTYM